MNKNLSVLILTALATTAACNWGMQTDEHGPSQQIRVSEEPSISTPTATPSPTASPLPTSTPTPHTPTPTPSGTPTPTPAATGWTPLLPSNDSRIVYVSASDPSNCRSYSVGEVGLNPVNPGITPGTCRTLEAAYALVRNGFPDWVLVKRGDVISLSDTLFWERNGRSVSEKMVLGAYGPATAALHGDLGTVLAPSNRSAFQFSNRSHIAVVDLYVKNPGASAMNANGFNIENNSDDLLLEGNTVDGFSTSILAYAFVAGSDMTRIKVRRNVLINAFPAPNECKSFGIYGGSTSGVSTMHDFLIEENNFIKTGLANGAAGGTGCQLAHAIYMADENAQNFGITLRGNLFLHNADGGKMDATDAVIEGNVYIKNAVGAGTALSSPNATIRDNTILDGTTYRDNTETTGILMNHGNLNYEIAGNLIAHNRFDSYGVSNPSPSVFGINTDTGSNLHIHDNIIYNWCSPYDDGTAAIGWYGGGYSSTVIENNEFQQNCANKLFRWDEGAQPWGTGIAYRGNRYFSARGNPFQILSFAQWVAATGETGSWIQITYQDPNRDAATYMNQAFQSLSGYAAFENAAALQTRLNWNSRITAVGFNAYMRQGFLH